ncbi:MAG: hypothetical protein ACYCP0_06740 [Acidiferrobacteraceae bacterium]
MAGPDLAYDHVDRHALPQAHALAPTPSLKLPDVLKQRAAAAAQKQGITPAFMIQAIEQAATAAEQRAHFMAEAEFAGKILLKSGKGYVAGEVHAYLRRRVSGQRPVRPKAKSWRG